MRKKENTFFSPGRKDTRDCSLVLKCYEIWQRRYPPAELPAKAGPGKPLRSACLRGDSGDSEEF